MYFPTNKRELLQMYRRMLVWKYGRALKLLLIFLGNLALFWWIISSW